jgi:hypothetical protein
VRGAPQLTCGVLCMLLMTTSHLAADVFVDKPIKEADDCGFIQDASGAAISEATVKAISGVRTIATATTLSDGSFHFAESTNMQVKLEVSAREFVTARNTIGRMHTTDSKKCKHPVYAVLAVGQGHSFITAKKSELPKTK